MTTITCFLAAVLLGQVASAQGRYEATGGNPVLEKAVIKVRDEADIPSPEPGVLVQLKLREGDLVKEGDLIAVVDDREAKAAVEVAEFAYQAADKRAKQTIEIEYAAAAAKVAEAEVQQDREVNQIKPGAVPETEVRRKKLDLTRAELQIEKAQNDRVLAGFDAKTKKAELKAARMALERRIVYSPFDGEVIVTHARESEWVSPGDPILKLVRHDTLYVEGKVDATLYDRSEILGKPVTVEVTKARGRKVAVSGKIVYAALQLRLKSRFYTVRAEVENEQVNGGWQLLPGGNAKMTILLDGTAQAPRSAQDTLRRQ